MSMKQDILNKLPVILVDQPQDPKKGMDFNLVLTHLHTLLGGPNRDHYRAALLEIRDEKLYPNAHTADYGSFRTTTFGCPPAGWTPPVVDKPRIRVKAGKGYASDATVEIGIYDAAIHTHSMSHPWLVRAERAELERAHVFKAYAAIDGELSVCRKALAEAEAEIERLTSTVEVAKRRHDETRGELENQKRLAGQREVQVFRAIDDLQTLNKHMAGERDGAIKERDAVHNMCDKLDQELHDLQVRFAATCDRQARDLNDAHKERDTLALEVKTLKGNLEQAAKTELSRVARKIINDQDAKIEELYETLAETIRAMRDKG